MRTFYWPLKNSYLFYIDHKVPNSSKSHLSDSELRYFGDNICRAYSRKHFCANKRFELSKCSVISKKEMKLSTFPVVFGR